MYRLKISKLKDFDENNYLESAELTQEMCDILNPRLPRNEILSGNALVSIFSANPTSLHSSKINIIKFREAIRKGASLEQDIEFKEKTKNCELKIELIFFISKYYETSDIDNRVKTVLDASNARTLIAWVLLIIVFVLVWIFPS